MNPPDIDETLIPGPVPEAVRDLALRKARFVADHEDHGAFLGADTVVEVEGQVLGKPRDESDARRMLDQLSNTTHHVHTGVALVHRPTGLEESAVATTAVRMRVISPEERDAYVASGEPMDKAGGYAVQETGDRFVEALDGDFDNVVGLPMAVVRTLLERLASRVARA